MNPKPRSFISVLRAVSMQITIVPTKIGNFFPRSISTSSSVILKKRFSTNFSDDKVTEDIIAECLELRRSLQPINDRIGGPLEKNSEKNTILPFVFLLGNHSSGKSSFVNYVLQRKVRSSLY